MGLIEKAKNVLSRNHEVPPAVPVKDGFRISDDSAFTPVESQFSNISLPNSAVTSTVDRVVNEPIVQQHVTHHHVDHVTPMIEREHHQTVHRQIVQPIQEQKTELSHHTEQDRHSYEEIQGSSHSVAPTPLREQVESCRHDYDGKSSTVINNPVVKDGALQQHVVEEIQPVVQQNIDHTHMHHRNDNVRQRIQHSARVDDIVEK